MADSYEVAGMTDYTELVGRLNHLADVLGTPGLKKDIRSAVNAIERLVAERREWNATITAERERMDRLVEQAKAERDALREALDFCGSLAKDELPYHKAGTAAEVALRHIAKAALDALGEQEEKP